MALSRRQTVEGRWIHLNGKVPRTAANIHVSSLTELPTRPTDKFSVINDEPLKLLSHEEEELLERIVN